MILSQINKLFLIFLAFFTLSACTTQKFFVALPESIQEQITLIDAYNVKCPEQMGYDIEKSHLTHYTGGGLLFVLIDAGIESHRASKARNAIEDIQEHLLLIDLQKIFDRRIIPVLKQTSWLCLKQVETIDCIQLEELRERAELSGADAILVSQFDYRLSPDFQTLSGTLYVTLYPASDKIKAMLQTKNPGNTPIFRTKIKATESLKNPGKNIVENGAKWVDENGAYLKAALDSLIASIAYDLKQVLKHPNYIPED